MSAKKRAGSFLRRSPTGKCGTSTWPCLTRPQRKVGVVLKGGGASKSGT